MADTFIMIAESHRLLTEAPDLPLPE